MFLERGEKNFFKIISSDRVVGMKLAFHYFIKGFVKNTSKSTTLLTDNDLQQLV
jgi:hypothetical protein